jgi:hypothetical protein
MVDRFWLQEDQRDRSFAYATQITDDMLAESFGFQENQLELITSVGSFRFADRPKYVGVDFYEGRIASLPKAERVMPDIFSSNVELSECSLTVCNVDGYFTKYLPGGEDYKTFIGDNVMIQMCLRNEESSKKSIFLGAVSYENGVSYNVNEITFKFRDKLDFLNNKYPLESITKEAFPDAPQENIGKLIPIALGDFTANWEWKENGTQTYSVGEASGLVVVNMTPVGLGGGLPGYCVGVGHTGGAYFLFHTGGRAGKTYRPLHIEDVMIKRGSNYLWGVMVEAPWAVAGHWACYVTHVKARTEDGDLTYYPYEHAAGDLAVIKVKVPIEGETWDELRDTSPMEQAKEALIALGRLSSYDIDGASFELMKGALLPSSSGGGSGKIKIAGNFPTELNGSLFGGFFTFSVYKEDGSVYKMLVWFNDVWQGTPYPEIAFLDLFDNAAFPGLSTTPSNNKADCGNAALLADWIATNLNMSIGDEGQRLCKFEVSVTSDTEAYIYLRPYYRGIAASPIFTGLPFSWEVEEGAVVTDGVKTRIYFGDNDKTVLSSVGSLLKCALIDMYVDKNLKISFSSLWPQHYPQLGQIKNVLQYDIVEPSVEVYSDQKNFFTCAQANYSWLSWINRAGGQTKRMKNSNAEAQVGRSIIKEIDLPALYREADALAVLSTYIRLASAYLVSLKMKLGWKHLLRDLGEFVCVSFKQGSLNFDKVPCQIRKIAILPEVTGLEVEVVAFINFSYPNYISPSAAKNLSSFSQILEDA